MHLIRGLNATVAESERMNPKPPLSGFCSGKESGQTLVLFAFLLPLIMLFMGLGIDFGFGYLTKAKLAKAVDAASLAAMLNLGKGQDTATAIAQSVFFLNYDATWGANAAAPTVDIGFRKDENGEPIVDVTGRATIRTYFIGLAGFHDLSVANYAQATRPPVVLSLVLDRSGSMKGNGGKEALPPAVTSFLDYFIEDTDELGEVSFASAEKEDVPMTKSFHAPITNFVNNVIVFDGATFAQGGLNKAEGQVTGVSPLPTNAQQVIVYFTDGHANTNQDSFPGCGTVNYGGVDAPNEGYAFFNITTGAEISCSATQFTPHDPALSSPSDMNVSNDTTEAEYRAITWADNVRGEKIAVYAIGLGNNINQTYLQRVAINPAASDKYNGIAVFAPTADDLKSAFQKIAERIVLRLTN